MNPHQPYIQDNNNVLVHLTIKPNAKKNTIQKIDNKSVFVSLKAEPSQGKANEALIEFFSDLLKKPVHHFILKKGHTSPKKILLIKNCTFLEISTFFQNILQGA
jgi:uncharacterized protein (TIGR00251 family)